MKQPDDRDLLSAWEQGWNGTPTERALALLSMGFPDCSVESLAGLTIGRRDGLLLLLRKWLFGSELEIVVNCPSCGAELEFTADVDDLRVMSVSPDNPFMAPVSVSIQHDGWSLMGQVPTSETLLPLERKATDLDDRHLLARCLEQVEYQGEERSHEEIPGEVVERLDEAIRENDPQAELLFDLTCPDCEQDWESVFDIGLYLWKEVDVEARRLMRQVDRLAWAYGWSESDILDLAPFRRNGYLDLLETSS